MRVLENIQANGPRLSIKKAGRQSEVDNPILTAEEPSMLGPPVGQHLRTAAAPPEPNQGERIPRETIDEPGTDRAAHGDSMGTGGQL